MIETKRQAPQVGPGERRQQTEELHGDAQRGAQSQPQQVARTFERMQRRCRVNEVKPHQHADADNIVGDGHPRPGRKAIANIKQCRGNANDPVEEDLGHEPAQQ